MPIATQALLLVTILVAAYFDLRFRRIPNWLVLSAILLALALNTFLFALPGLRTAGLGLGLAFAVYFPLYLLRGMGAGDVKLMMAIGALVGPGPWFLIFICTGLLGGVVGLIVLFARGRFRQSLWNIAFLLNRLVHFQAPYAGNPELDIRSGKGLRLPHGVVIALGTIAFLVIAKLRSF